MNPVESATTDVTIQYLPEGGVALRQPDIEARANIVELNKNQILQAAGVLRQWNLGNHVNLQTTLQAVEYTRSDTDAIIRLFGDGDVYVIQEDSNGNVNGWSAQAGHTAATNITCTIYVGASADDQGVPDGAPQCTT